MESIGGQALVEGVLIKTNTSLGIAVRNTKGDIVTKKQPFTSVTKKNKLLNLPFIRGIIVLIETMVTGIKALNYSSAVAVEEETEENGSTLAMVGTLVLSVGFALFIFKFLPLFLAQLFASWSTILENRFLFNLSEGLIKIGFLLGYVYAISFIPDIRRVFQYHGAEHKVVNAYEHNDLANAKGYSTIHVRCGTSFIIFVITVSILIYIFLPTDISFLSKYGLRLLLLPLIAGVAYELIKISPKFENNIMFKVLILPGLLMQKITTKEPDDKQLEVAKAALHAAL